MDTGKSDGNQSSMLIAAPQDGYKTMESTFCPIAFQHLTEHQTKERKKSFEFSIGKGKNTT